MYKLKREVLYIMSRLRIKKTKRNIKIATILYNHIRNNKRGYLTVTILLFIGVIISIILINNLTDTQINEVYTYLNELVDIVKRHEKIDLFSLFKESVKYNLVLMLVLWIGASTIIGIPIVYGVVFIKGFSIGYTISSIISCFGMEKGILFSLSAILLHNIIFIPAMLGTSVSGLKLYETIIKSREKANIKIEILRHTIFCIIMMGFMIISSVIEIYLSNNLLINLLRRL